uniref:Uncharacterized protein n=1 Tax=Anopheles coluzzii TaxID=1518534 RepID=A0A8W7NYK1_ANOCL
LQCVAAISVIIAERIGGSRRDTMPDNTGRDARMKKEELSTEDDKKKLLLDMVTKLMEDASLNSENAQDIGFVMPATDDEPEKFVRLSDLERSLEDMALVHEIAINEKFQLKPTSPGSVGYVVQKTVKDAYWNLMRELLAQQPPCYTMVIQLLLDIKETFKSLLRGNNDRALDAILVVLDEHNIRQLADEHGAAVLEHNAHARSLAELQTLCGNQFPATMAWLQRNNPAGRERPSEEGAAGGNNGVSATTVRTVRLTDVVMPDYYIDAYQELIQPGADHPFPELLKLDLERVVQLKEQAMRLSVCATVMQLTCATVPTLANHPRRCDLAAKLAILSADYPGKVELQELLESLCVQVLDCVSAHADEPSGSAVPDAAKQALKTQILRIDRTMTVYSVVWRKMMQYMRELLLTEREEHVPFPVCFRDYRDETVQLAGQFKRIVSHNFEVYGNFYLQSMQELV